MLFRSGDDRSQTSLQAIDLASDTAVPSMKRKKPGSQGTATAHRLYPTCESQMLQDHAPTSANRNGEETRDYGAADLDADMADVNEFAFWNDVQRCEMLLGALSSNLEICKEHMSADMVATMAEGLEVVVRMVGQMS